MCRARWPLLGTGASKRRWTCIVHVSHNTQGLKAEVDIVLTCRTSSCVNCRWPALAHTPLHVGWHAWEACWHATWHASCSKGVGPRLPWLTPHVLHGCFHGLLHHLQYVHVLQKPIGMVMYKVAYFAKMYERTCKPIQTSFEGEQEFSKCITVSFALRHFCWHIGRCLLMCQTMAVLTQP